MKVGFIIAMDNEYAQMRRIIGGKPEGYFAGNAIALWQCGIGKANAAMGAIDFINQQHPDCIFCTGLAGAISEELNVKDFVIGEQAMYHDVWCGEPNEYGQVQGMPTRFDADKRLVEIVKNVKTDHHVMSGLICTGDQFVTTGEKIEQIHKLIPEALTCDMESAAIAQACYQKQVPFLSLRIVSDTPGRTTNHAQQWQDFMKEMSNYSFRWILKFLNELPSAL